MNYSLSGIKVVIRTENYYHSLQILATSEYMFMLLVTYSLVSH